MGNVFVLQKSGVLRGTISSLGTYTGCILGSYIVRNNSNFDQLYCKEQVQLNCNSFCGGIIGIISVEVGISMNISNSYSRSNIMGESKKILKKKNNHF